MHTRTVAYHGFRREDGLWDIEAELTDTKPFELGLYRPKPLPAGAPVHHLAIRLTLDDEFVVRDIVSALDATPFGECAQAGPPLAGLVGARVASGWRKAIDEAIGGTRGCTHLRELLANMATVAFQTIPAGQARLRQLAGEPEPVSDRPPFHVGGCITWDANGPTVQRHYPQFVGWEPLRRAR
ncbi:DUF2889 domain-containing protein [Ramlibacter rhizophilus]|nr:DUF2889 domain-containing protein [Ramlibacter rhizophilus]